jgi:hypothetical protein
VAPLASHPNNYGEATHFDKYPLLTKKRADFIQFKSIINLINKKDDFLPPCLSTAKQGVRKKV